MLDSASLLFFLGLIRFSLGEVERRKEKREKRKEKREKREKRNKVQLKEREKANFRRKRGK